MSLLRLSYRRNFKLMALIFVVGLFIDSSNLPDVFIGKTFAVDHDDSALTAVPLGPAQSKTISHSPFALTKMPSAQTAAHARVMYDEDSPSIETDDAFPILSAPAVSVDSRVRVQSPFVADQLYLRNSNLLI